MKAGILILTGMVLMSAGCASIKPEVENVRRTASVVRVPKENVESLQAMCAELKAAGTIQHGGLYLREIEGETYLFQYLEVASHDGHKTFQCLEKNMGGGSASFQGLEKKLGAGTAGFEPMERIFYEAGVSDKTPEADVMRIAMFTELKPEKEAHYRLLHDNPWPDVIAAIHKANFRHFSVFLEEINGRVYLFGWLEYVGSDIDADGAENKKDPASIRWWKETDACQIAPSDAGDGMWGGMEELLFLER